MAITLREARRAAGLTQAQLGKRAHVTQKTISAIEHGKILEPSHLKVVCICRALNVDPEQITEFSVGPEACE